MAVSSEQQPSKQELFIRDGYTVARDCIPRVYTRSLVREIDAQIEKHGISDSEWQLHHNNAVSKDAPYQCPAVESILSHPALQSEIESLLGKQHNCEIHPSVAVRLPQVDKGLSFDVWHIDNVRKDGILNFQLLIGICLNTMDTRNSGNFTVFPGGHAQLNEGFRKNEYYVHRRPNGSIQLPRLPLKPPTQLLVSEGDVFFCHTLLPHRVSPNLSPNTSYILYLRVYSPHLPVSHPMCCALRLEALRNLWVGYSGLQGLPVKALDYDLKKCECGDPSGSASGFKLQMLGRGSTPCDWMFMQNFYPEDLYEEVKSTILSIPSERWIADANGGRKSNFDLRTISRCIPFVKSLVHMLNEKFSMDLSYSSRLHVNRLEVGDSIIPHEDVNVTIRIVSYVFPEDTEELQGGSITFRDGKKSLEICPISNSALVFVPLLGVTHEVANVLAGTRYSLVWTFFESLSSSRQTQESQRM